MRERPSERLFERFTRRQGARVATLSVLLLPALANGQTVPAPPGPHAPSAAASGPRITLQEAVRRTLEASPDILLAMQRVVGLQGILLETTGRFDPALSFTPGFQRGLTAVIGTVSGAEAVRSFGSWLATVGDPPKVNVLDTFTMDLTYNVPLRNGMILSPLVETRAVEDGYQARPADPALGGKGIPTQFHTMAGLRLEAPLARGGGTASVTANEVASKLNLEVSREALAQTAAGSVLTTVLAYWSLAAAQESLALLERSAEQERQIEGLSKGLVAGDEIPPSELDKIRARVADADAAAAQARQALVAARVALALSMGASLTDLDGAPLAADPMPDPSSLSALEKTSVQDLSSMALVRRADLKAARGRRDVADVLQTAARLDLRPRLDLTLQAGATALYEDLDRGAVSATGTWKSISGSWSGPSVFVGLHLELPVGNRSALGQYAQAQAVRREAQIAAGDLERTVRDRTFEVSTSVRNAAREVRERQESVVQHEKTISASFDQFRAGEMSLIDAILTEKSQTLAALGLVAARQTYASRLAELRFETGSLLKYSSRQGQITFDQFMPEER